MPQFLKGNGSKKEKFLFIKGPYQNHLIFGIHVIKITYGTRREAEKVSNIEVMKCCRGIPLN